MLAKFRTPGYLPDKMARNAVDFWSAAGTMARSRQLLLTSLAWLALYAASLVVTLREARMRWLVLVCFAFVGFTWFLYLPFFAVFRFSVPTAPFIAATMGLAVGARMRKP